MAAITIPEPVQQYFPHTLDPAQLWVNYNAHADSLTVYFTSTPAPSVWENIDDCVYIGFASDNETRVTGVMIEHFSQWLLLSRRRSGEPGHLEKDARNPG